MSDPDLDVLDPFERPEVYPPRPSLTAAFRRVRARLIPRTIRIHEGELDAVMRFPLGAMWRRHLGRDWCPVCSSIAPHTLLREMAKVEFWDRDKAAVEFKALVERNEMASTNENWRKVVCPPAGTGYGHYNYNPVLGRFEAFSLAVGSERFGFNLMHLYDLSLPHRSLALGHLNRLAPGVHWVMEPNGDLMCSSTSLVIYSNDDDDDETPTGELDDDQGENDQ